MYVRMRMNVTL